MRAVGARPVAAAPGDLDPSFGSHGIVRIGFGDPAASGAMALQPDGRIVSAGTRFSSDESDFALARLNADGSLDPSFAGDGLKTTGFAVAGNAQPADSAADVALGSDGRILVAGSSAEAFGLARYTPDGELDGSFGDGGLVRTEFPEGLAGAATAPRSSRTAGSSPRATRTATSPWPATRSMERWIRPSPATER